MNSKTSTWNFFSNYAHVLFLISRNQDITARELSDTVGITERAARRIISELQKEGFIKISKNGRQNAYSVNLNKPLKHPVESHIKIGELLTLINNPNSNHN